MNAFYTKIAKDAKPVEAHRSKLASVIKGLASPRLRMARQSRACLEIGCEPHIGLFAPFATLV
jgi:hypothetical protein